MCGKGSAQKVVTKVSLWFFTVFFQQQRWWPLLAVGWVMRIAIHSKHQILCRFEFTSNCNDNLGRLWDDTLNSGKWDQRKGQDCQEKNQTEIEKVHCRPLL